MKTIVIAFILSLGLIPAAYSVENTGQGATLGNVDCKYEKMAKKLDKEIAENGGKIPSGWTYSNSAEIINKQ